MLDNLNNYKIILGSNSPRRKELLAGLGVAFEVRTIPDIDESYPSSLQGEEIPEYIARKKANSYLDKLADDELLITGDTIVWTFTEVIWGNLQTGKKLFRCFLNYPATYMKL